MGARRRRRDAGLILMGDASLSPRGGGELAVVGPRMVGGPRHEEAHLGVGDGARDRRHRRQDEADEAAVDAPRDGGNAHRLRYTGPLNGGELILIHVVVAAHTVRASGAGTDDDRAGYVEGRCRMDTTEGSGTGVSPFVTMGEQESMREGGPGARPTGGFFQLRF